MIFEWNEIKSRKNLKKYGVSFDEARTVFLDEFSRLILDPDHSEGEARFVLMGTSFMSNLLLVCHSEKDLDVIRIISARKANKWERKQYEGYKNA